VVIWSCLDTGQHEDEFPPGMLLVWYRTTAAARQCAHTARRSWVSTIPVGGGVVYPSHGVVVTQPTAGTFKCFSSSCTHLGCTVDKVAAGLIQCPCHGARFSIDDGSVKAGPAPRPLTVEQFTVQDGVVVLD
jgi:Rieske Fe-S protein